MRFPPGGGEFANSLPVSVALGTGNANATVGVQHEGVSGQGGSASHVKASSSGSRPKLLLVSSKETGGRFAAGASGFHRIPGIGPWFLALPDDVFMMKEFDWSNLYDFAERKPYAHAG